MTGLLPDLQQWERGPKIVAVGGGTGLSTMLRGLKKYTKKSLKLMLEDTDLKKLIIFWI